MAQARSSSSAKRAGRSGPSRAERSRPVAELAGGAADATRKRQDPDGAADATRGPEGPDVAEDSLSAAVERLISRILNPLDLVVLTRERIQEVLDEAAERGRLTRSDANDLVLELVRRGRQQTDELLKDLEQLLGRGRSQIGAATRRARRSEPVDQLVRPADRARRSLGVGSEFPISDYDELTASQVTARLQSLSQTQLHRVREYEARHANRKSVLDAIDRALG